MSRTSDQVLDAIGGNVVPDGWAWNHDPDSVTMRSFRPLADFAATFEAAAEAQLFEATPATAELLLGAYERVLGPDTCLGDPATLTFDQRRKSVSARWIRPSDASIPGLIALAAAYGVAISITEVRRTSAGVLRAGAHRVCHPEQFCWIVSMGVARVIHFTAGSGRAGNSIGLIERNTQIECVINRAAPSHTVPIFQYSAGTGTVGVWGVSKWGDGSVWL